MKPLHIANIFSRAQAAISYSSCALVTGSFLLAGTALAAPPANDDFANAIVLPGNSGVQTGTNNTDATFQAGEPVPFNSALKTVWFKWTAPTDGEFNLTTDGSDDLDLNEWDAVLGLYSGPALNALTPLGGTPIDESILETKTLAVTAGTTYYIQLAGNKGINLGDPEVPSDNIQLTWSFVANAQIATFGPGAVVGAVSGNAATINLTLPFHTNLATYAPTFTLSPGATCDRVSGTIPTPNFGSGPVTYTVTSQGGTPVINTYTVTATVAGGLDWNLAFGGDWDFLSTTWLKQPGAVVSAFTNGDTVAFSNSAGGNISIPAAVAPGSTIVDATAGTYTFSGSGPLTGTGSLTKSNAGTLKLTGSNTSTGSTVVNGGTLEATSTDALGFSSSYTVATGSTLALSGLITDTAGDWPKRYPVPAGSPAGTQGLATLATLTGGGTVNVDLGNASNVGLIFNMSAFTGDLNLTNGMVCSYSPRSPGFIPPTTGSINIGTGATLYLGWGLEPYTANIRLNSGDGNSEKAGMLRGDASAINGTIVLNTNATLGSYSTGNTLTVNSVISDGNGSFGFTSVAGGTVILTAANNTYTGPTVVNATSKLQIDTAGALGSGPLDIKGKMNLRYSGTRVVSSLTIGGVVKTAPGTYGTTSSGATFKDNTFFITTLEDVNNDRVGTVTLLPVTETNYDTWLTGFTFVPGADKTSTGDPDGDGMTNQNEYAFGLNPTLGTSVNPITQQLDKTTGNFQYTRRATPAAAGLTYTVFTSTNLVTWVPSGATETGFTTAGDIQTVTVNVTAPAVDGKLFVRVEAKPTL
jgi:autotransporter-associated beta strand protein